MTLKLIVEKIVYYNIVWPITIAIILTGGYYGAQATASTNCVS